MTQLPAEGGDTVPKGQRVQFVLPRRLKDPAAQLLQLLEPEGESE